MSFSAIINTFIIFVQKHLLIALAIGILLLYLLIQKPNFFFIALLYGLLLIGVFYLSTVISPHIIRLWQ